MKPCTDAPCFNFPISFAGLLILISKRIANSINVAYACIFAAGALLAAALLHIIPEALEGLESKFDDLHELGISAGIALLGGLFFGIVLHAFVEASHSHGPESHQHLHDADMGGQQGDSVVAAGKTGLDHKHLHPSLTRQAQVDGAVTGTDDCHSTTTRPLSVPEKGIGAQNLQVLMDARRGKVLTDIMTLQPVCWNVILGDLVHNFADGVTIGAAFLGCSSTIGWTVTASAVLHEIPHEIADFMALINGGMSTTQVRLDTSKYISFLVNAPFVVIMHARNCLPITSAPNKAFGLK